MALLIAPELAGSYLQLLAASGAAGRHGLY